MVQPFWNDFLHILSKPRAVIRRKNDRHEEQESPGQGIREILLNSKVQKFFFEDGAFNPEVNFYHAWIQL